MMTLYSADNTALMQINAIERDGNELLIRGKVFGTMPMTARLRPSEARKGLRLLGFRVAWLLLTLVFRRD
jgi:hypothetical protein